MTSNFALTAAAIAALTITGCDKYGGKRHEKVDAAAVERQIKEIETAWEGDYRARNVDGIAARYAEDAALANPGAPLAANATSRRDAIAQFVADPNLDMSFASDRVQVAKSGDLAYSRGHFTLRSTDPTTRQPRTDTGNYLTVWQKQADGSWKAVEDFITPGAPATG